MVTVIILVWQPVYEKKNSDLKKNSTTEPPVSGHGNSIHNIIPLLKKENVHLFLCSWGYNNYTDVYLQSFWEDVALEVTMSSVKSMDVTCKTHSG